MKFTKSTLLVPYDRAHDAAFYAGNRDMPLQEYAGLALGDFHIRKHKHDKRYINDYLPDGYVISSLASGATVCRGVPSNKLAKDIAIALYEGVKSEPISQAPLGVARINERYVNECREVLTMLGIM